MLHRQAYGEGEHDQGDQHPVPPEATGRGRQKRAETGPPAAQPLVASPSRLGRVLHQIRSRHQGRSSAPYPPRTVRTVPADNHETGTPHAPFLAPVYPLPSRRPRIVGLRSDLCGTWVTSRSRRSRRRRPPAPPGRRQRNRRGSRLGVQARCPPVDTAFVSPLSARTASSAGTWPPRTSSRRLRRGVSCPAVVALRPADHGVPRAQQSSLQGRRQRGADRPRLVRGREEVAGRFRGSPSHPGRVDLLRLRQPGWRAPTARPDQHRSRHLVRTPPVVVVRPTEVRLRREHGPGDPRRDPPLSGIRLGEVRQQRRARPVRLLGLGGQQPRSLAHA